MKPILLAHPVRTGMTSIARAWGLAGTNAWQEHDVPGPRPDRFVVSFVRNPYPRVFSFWRFTEDAEGAAFAEWVKSDRFWRHTTRDGTPMMSPCTLWTEHADWMGRFEHREADLVALSTLVERDIPTLHVGRTGGDWRAAYDDEARELVAERFAADLNAFGYGWEA